MKTSVSELARVFGVSRQAVHEWIKGGALSPRNARRLSELAQVADVFVKSGIEVAPQMLRRKIGGGHSLLESVKEGGNIVELAHTLVDTLARESQQRQHLTARLAGRQKPTLTANDFGTPHFD
ncbi:MAG: helix-turn-helix domain-containing protein [Nitrosospira sp.]|nr:helix-turn-helix domain-containing protein [Nitrosospira sp.]